MLNLWKTKLLPVLKSPIFWKSLSPTLLILAVATILRDATAASASAAAEIFRAAAALAWPGIAFYFIFLFRTEIRLLIARVRKASVSGLEFAEAAAAQSAIPPITDILPRVDPQAANNPITTIRSTRLREILDKEFPEPGKQAEREGLLIGALARSQAINHYLRIYGSIFGSQVEALERSLSGSEWIDLLPFHASHRQRFAERAAAEHDTSPPLEFAEWAHFLQNTGLMEVEATRGRITDEGRDYIDYINSQKLARVQVF